MALLLRSHFSLHCFCFHKGTKLRKTLRESTPLTQTEFFHPLRKASASFFSDCMSEHFVPPVSDCCEPFISETKVHTEQTKKKVQRCDILAQVGIRVRPRADTNRLGKLSKVRFESIISGKSCVAFGGTDGW